MSNPQSFLSALIAQKASRSFTFRVDPGKHIVTNTQVQSTALSEDKTDPPECIGILRYLVGSVKDIAKIKGKLTPTQIVWVLHDKGEHWKCVRGARLKDSILELYLNSEEDEDTARQHGEEIAECFAFDSPKSRLLAPEYLIEVLRMDPGTVPSFKDLPDQFTSENHKVATDAFIKNGRVVIGFESREVARELQRIAANRDARFIVGNVLNHTRPKIAEL
ncbi:unnamed protein product [Clonostachys byssicola]|uniref:Uncharacterized protein n=1 Tax=Clonostachys byssicola TaxID=160290 RepID=A0A9N9U5W1_9HYPO|nr:unnamed protein product [Clonostachys byssicola]